MWRKLILFFLLCGYGPAYAASYEQAQAALMQGEFDQAYKQAIELSSTEGLVLGAEALNAKLLLGLSKKPSKTAKAAMALADKVLQQDSTNAEAQLQYAIAYGFYGRQVSPFKAWRKKIPLKILAEIDKARITGPMDARTFALLGAWHLSVVQRAGRKNAKKLYGANEEDGLFYFDQARQADPTDMIILANYTLMRYVLHPKIEETMIKENLQMIITATPQNAVEGQLQSQLQPILSALNESKGAVSMAKDFITR